MTFKFLAVIGFLFIFTHALAQSIDECATTPIPGSPAALLVQKLKCRLQIEDNTRMASEENLIIAQADQKIAEAKAAHLIDQYTKIDNKLTETQKYWALYQSELVSRIDNVCAWHGTQNKPAGDLCRWWRHAH